MLKSPDAFRTISEVGDELDLPQHVLRFWETRFPAIRPLKRGGGRRYYRPEDVDLLKGIRHLLYGEGYTIKGVQRIIREDGPRAVQAIGRGERTAPRPSTSAGDRDEDPRDFASEPGEEDALDAPRTDPDTPAPVYVIGGGLSREDAARLQAALAELVECERIIGTLSAE